MNMKRIHQIIKKNKTFLISTHVNPDPDALCSELALSMYLRSRGKSVHIVNEEKVPRRFEFLPGSSGIKAFKKSKKVSYDVAIVLDCGELSRVGNVSGLIHAKKPLINIDHHFTNDHFGTNNYVKVEASSTSEIVYDLLADAGAKVTKNIALNLYVGIMTDTGSFRYENTTAHTHAIASQLMKHSFSAFLLYQKLYEMIPIRNIKNFTHVISRFDSLYKGKVACVNLPKAVVTKFSEDFDLRDTIFRFLRSIKGIEVICIFTEAGKGKTRINLRSSGKVNVAKIAHAFDGGGHRMASGCMIEKNIRGARKEMLIKIRKVL